VSVKTKTKGGFKKVADIMSRRCLGKAQAGNDLLTAVQFTQSLALTETTAYLTRFLDLVMYCSQ
jgi:hypothetical protein